MKQIQLSKKSKRYPEPIYALVDDEDYEMLMKWNWCVYKNGNNLYAARGNSANSEFRTTHMHRVIMNSPKGLSVDHIDHNGLNNQKSNLRNCTQAQNQWNKAGIVDATSKYKGVCLATCKNPHITKKGVRREYVYYRWRADIVCNKKHYWLGFFKTQEEAAKAYNEKAKELHSDFAVLNIIN